MSEINRLAGRLRAMVDAAAALGPMRADDRYRQMIGHDLPLGERTERARRNYRMLAAPDATWEPHDWSDFD